eukprot:scaffold57273_cov62-Attheya_sp.AAC.5
MLGTSGSTGLMGPHRGAAVGHARWGAIVVQGSNHSMVWTEHKVRTRNGAVVASEGGYSYRLALYGGVEVCGAVT